MKGGGKMKTSSNRVLFSTFLVLGVLALAWPAVAKDYLYAPGPNLLSIVDCETDTVVKTVPYEGYIVDATPSQDGKRAICTRFSS